jgi:mRNA interferase MazF
MNFIKNFLDWSIIKPKLDIQNHKPSMVQERDFWWCYFGENIGVEISGKSIQFTRPAIIYKKLSAFTFLVIPCSTKIKDGTWFIKFTHNTITQVAILSQIRIIDYRRLKNKIGRLDDNDFNEITNGFDSLYSKQSQK